MNEIIYRYTDQGGQTEIQVDLGNGSWYVYKNGIFQGTFEDEGNPVAAVITQALELIEETAFERSIEVI